MRHLHFSCLFLFVIIIASNINAQINNNTGKSQSRAYCMSYSVALNDEDIFNVAFGTLNNSSTCSTTGGAGSMINQYSNYKAITPSDIPQNMSVPFSILIGTCGGNGNNAIKIFIDYNQDTDFTDPGENVYTSAAQTSGPHTESGNIMIPLIATIGNTVMRVVNASNSISSITSCSTNNFGETEDYTINIVSCPCISPTNLSATNIQHFQADINWQEATLTSKWQYEWGLHGFTPGTGTRDTTTHKPHTLTGLVAAKSYDFYVRSICCTGNDTSSWVGPYNFNTLCNTITAFPYIESFDSITAPIMPVCWSVANNNSDAYYWKTSANNPHSAPNSMYVRFNPYLAMDDWFFTPQFHFETGKYYKVEFWYSSYGLYYTERLEVKWGISANPAGMTGGAVFNDNNVNSIYKRGSGIIAPTITGDYYVGFHGYSAADMYFLAVDDIVIKEVPYADITVLQQNVSNCDTLGWFHPPITIKNIGQDTVKVGDTIACTYVLNAGNPVTQKFVASTFILPGDSATYFFTSQVHLNTFTSSNVLYSALWEKDMNSGNNTKAFTVTMLAVPAVNLGNDVTLCDDQSILLDAGNPGATYYWWNGSAGQTHLINVSYCSSGSTCNYSVTVTAGGCSKADTIAVTFDPCTGIYENAEASINIFPNPSRDVIIIENPFWKDVCRILVFDLNGKLLIEQNLVSEKTFVDVSILAKGIYFIKQIDKDGTLVGKFVKE